MIQLEPSFSICLKPCMQLLNCYRSIIGGCKLHPSICLVLHHPFLKLLQMEYQQSLSNCRQITTVLLVIVQLWQPAILPLPSPFLPTKIAPIHLPLLPLTTALAVLLIRDTSTCCILKNRCLISLIVGTISPKKKKSFLMIKKILFENQPR